MKPARAEPQPKPLNATTRRKTANPQISQLAQIEGIGVARQQCRGGAAGAAWRQVGGGQGLRRTFKGRAVGSKAARAEHLAQQGDDAKWIADKTPLYAETGAANATASP